AELSRELGVEPEPATQTVYERITSGEIHPAGDEILAFLQPALDSSSAPAPPQSDQESPANNLPAEPTPFFGRQQEIEAVTQQLLEPSSRLLTILGPGGCGKSRLAVHAARRLVRERSAGFPDGIWYVSLTKPSDAGQMVAALADGLPFEAFDLTSDVRFQLLSYLRGRQMLLLLDNMEYAQVPDVAQFLSELLDKAPNVTLLACSRTRLNLRAENLFPLAGLALPTGADLAPEKVANYSAMQLFVNSARRVRPDFELTDETIPPALSICRLLQGMPLAIELAASWVEVMSAAEVAREVERCLDFLETDWVDMPERQRSLRTIFETSWRLLNGPERAVFLRLSVFRGGFDYQAARQVADASQKILLGLLNKAWLQRDEDGRYLSHEMLRQYAYQLLSDDDVTWESAHDRHSNYFAELAQIQGELLKGPQQITATERLDDELENVTTAWNWLVRRDRFDTLTDQMLPDLLLYFAARCRGQRLVALVTHAYERLKASSMPAEPSWQIILLTSQAAFFNEFLISRYFIAEMYAPSGKDQISAAYEIACEHHLEDQLGIWSLLLAMLYGWAFDQTLAIQWLQRLVKEHRSGGDAWLLAFTLENLGGLMLPSGQGRPGGQAGKADAKRYLAEAASVFEKLGDRREKGYTLKLWGLLIREGDFSAAKRMLLDAQRDLEIANDPMMVTQIMGFLAEICMMRGEIAEGFAYYQRVRQESARLGHQHFEAGALSWESIWALRLDTVSHARQARQDSLDIAKKAADKSNVAWGTWELGEIERVAGNYDLARDLFEESRLLLDNLEDPYGAIFIERGLGDLAYARGDYKAAQRYFEESLRLAKELSHQWSAAYAYFGLGRAMLALSKEDRKDLVSRAQDYVLQGLQSAYYHRYFDLYSIGVAGLAACHAVSDRLEEAVRLIVIVRDHPLTWQETRLQVEEVQSFVLEKQPELAKTLVETDTNLPTLPLLLKELLETETK
ncbi:MAG: tetratricopeptide repeat protein, partial [Chloroflexota bacterium]